MEGVSTNPNCYQRLDSPILPTINLKNNNKCIFKNTVNTVHWHSRVFSLTGTFVKLFYVQNYSYGQIYLWKRADCF